MMLAPGGEGIDRDVVTGTLPAVLERIVDAGTALTVWERTPSAALAAALGRLDLDTVDDIDTETMPDADVAALLHDAGYADGVVGALAMDIATLLRRHAALTGAARLALRLEVIETDACRRFHADYVTFRLLCTYAGPGTQWHRVGTPEAIERIPTGAVSVFKGRLLLDPPMVLHRSPPIAGTGERRLVLAIDPVRPRDNAPCL